MAGLSSLLYILAIVALTPVVVLVAFVIYCIPVYAPVIRRIFEEQPLFSPLRIVPDDLGETVEFPTSRGLTLRGSYFKARTDARVGVLVFCHEFLGDRWSHAPYVDHLRDRGFDLFGFDFRNHGDSDVDPDYVPFQYVSDREVDDVKGALAYLRTRPDRDLAGYGLVGVSRGGGAAILAAADEADVWGVVTDGAFPTRGTMTAYIVRWATIFVRAKWFLRCVPRFVFSFLGDVARAGTERKRNCSYPSVERAVARLAPRPWLQIHGERDVYIGTDIADDLFSWARQPKEQWIVGDAKHNRCRELEPEAYARRLAAFLDRNAPRRPLAEIEAEAATDAAAFARVENPARAAKPSLAAKVAAPAVG